MTKNYDNLKIGTKIHYTGDMANIEGWGEITTVKGSKFYPVMYAIKLDDGRIFPGVLPLNFSGIGRRFVTEKEYEQERDQKMKELDLN